MSRHNVEAIPVAKIEKADFAAFEEVRKSGRWNMIASARDAADDAGLDIETYLGVLKNYSALMKKYPDVRK